jgi:hypothetical protein
MTAIERYFQELGRALHTRGRARRRLLAECRDHLADAAAINGEQEAVRRFGPAGELARSFDTEIAVRRATRATIATIVGVLAVGASTVALLNAATPHVSTVPAWAVVFFASAQTAGVCALLAVLRAAAMRHGDATPGDVVLLCRRNGAALAFSMTTLFAAGAAVPGHSSAWALLTGPVVALLAAISVAWARSLAHKLGARPRQVQAPLADLLTVAHQSDRVPRTAGHSPLMGLLAPTVAIGTVAAFLWDHLDHGSIGSSLAAASTEATLTVAGYMLLGPSLGLVPARRRGHDNSPA